MQKINSYIWYYTFGANNNVYVWIQSLYNLYFFFNQYDLKSYTDVDWIQQLQRCTDVLWFFFFWNIFIRLSYLISLYYERWVTLIDSSLYLIGLIVVPFLIFNTTFTFAHIKVRIFIQGNYNAIYRNQ